MQQNKKTMFPVLILMFLVVMCVSGCKTVSHVDELLVLKMLSEEQDGMGDEVERSDARFELLLKSVESGDILDYKDQFAVKGRFGSPIFIETIDEEGMIYQRWLYRYSTQFFGSKKVYLYFDNAGKFIKWNLVQ